LVYISIISLQGGAMEWKTRVTEILGSKYPIIQGAYGGFGAIQSSNLNVFLKYQFTGQDITGAQQKKACFVFQQGMLIFNSVTDFYTTQPLH